MKGCFEEMNILIKAINIITLLKKKFTTIQNMLVKEVRNCSIVDLPLLPGETK